MKGSMLFHFYPDQGVIFYYSLSRQKNKNDSSSVMYFLIVSREGATPKQKKWIKLYY